MISKKIRKNIKWSKIESEFERLFVKFGSLFDDEKEKLNNIEDAFKKHYHTRTAFVCEKMKEQLIEHLLFADVCNLIDESIIEDIPTWCPNFLKSFYIVFKNPIREVKALWGVFENNYLMICGQMSSGGVGSSIFFMDFENQKFDFGKDVLYSKNIKTENETGLYFVRFILTLALLLEAEKSPLQIKEEILRCSPSVYGAKINKILKTVLIKKTFAEKLKELAIIKVRGFLKNQAYGENWSKHRVIYIAPFKREQKINKEGNNDND